MTTPLRSLGALRSERERRRAAWPRRESPARELTALFRGPLVLAVLLAACAAPKGPAIDASSPGLDGGYAERYLTDATLWSAAGEAAIPKDAKPADAGGTHSPDALTEGGADTSVPACGYLAAFAAVDAGAAADAGQGGTMTCAREEACYAAPLMSAPTGRTLCAREGAGVEFAPCVAQDDCDGRHACDGVGDGSGLCRVRCDPRNPVLCPRGTQCWAFPHFLTAGLCR
jgi:hypothetical protein